MALRALLAVLNLTERRPAVSLFVRGLWLHIKPPLFGVRSNVPHLASNISIAWNFSMLLDNEGQMPRFFRISPQYPGYTENWHDNNVRL